MNHARFLKKLIPIAFVTGAAIESFMVLGPINGRNFYDVAKAKRVQRIREELESPSPRSP